MEESCELPLLESNPPRENAPDEDEHGGWTTFPFIIGNVIGLTLATSGWASNLIVFLITKYNIKSIEATQINNIVQGCNSVFPIAGAIIADSFLGSFSVVAIFSFASLLGVIMLTLTAAIPSLTPQPCPNDSLVCESPSSLQNLVLYSTLALSSIGLGGTRFTIVTMGANQFHKAEDQRTFFNWYFCTLYIAIATSLTVTIYVEDKVSWVLGFGICVIANAIGLVVFLLGKRLYRHVGEPKGSPFISVVRALAAGSRKREVSENLEGQDFYSERNGMSKMPYCAPIKNFRALKTEDDTISDGSDARSWRLCTVEEVGYPKTLIKIFPLWSTGIFLSTPIGILNNLIVLQALTMDRHLGPQFEIPPGSFLIFNIIATALSLSILDRIALTMWQKVTGKVVTPLQRIGVGHVLNILGMASAALVEAKRLGVVKSHHLMDQPGSTEVMSALWLVVPLAIVGVGEAFHFPGQVSLYYQEFPASLRSVSTAMISLLIAIGCYLSAAIEDLVRRMTGWLPDNINEGKLDNVFWLMAVIGVVNFGYYLTCAKFFKYQQNIEMHDQQPSGSEHD